MAPASKQSVSALSPDGSILAVVVQHVNSSIVVKCYDAKVTLGTVRFTLASKKLVGEVTQLTFASPTLLCALVVEAETEQQQIVVWDTHRGVVARTIIPSSPVSCLAAHASKILAFPGKVKDENDPPSKAVVHEYDAATGSLSKKIKCGTISGSCAFASCPQTSTIAILSDQQHVKFLNSDTGKKMGKLKLKEEVADADDASSILAFSDNGELLAVRTVKGVAVFKIENERRVALLQTSSDQISSMNLVRDEEEGSYILLLQLENKQACLYVLRDGDMNKQFILPKVSPCTVKSFLDNKHSLSTCYFSASDASSKLLALLIPFQSNSELEIHEVEYRDSSMQWISDSIQVGQKEDNTKISAGEKRKVEEEVARIPKSALVLGPGETGGEASNVSDHVVVPPSSKKAKITEEDEDFTKDPSIVDRLRSLTSDLQTMDSDDDDDDDDGSQSKEPEKITLRDSLKFVPKKATSESLTTLLSQALISNDDAMLELALEVHDSHVIEATVSGLAIHSSQQQLLSKLLTKLAARIAKTPNRATSLSPWIQRILVTASANVDQHSVITSLGPLRNLLQERVESFPRLLRLEGRLAVLGGQL